MMNYVIKQGDTLWDLARQHGTTVEALAQENGIADPNRIRAGMTLNIPGAAMEPTVGATPRARPQSVAAMADSAPIPNGNPARTPSSVMTEVGMEPEEPAQATLDYRVPVGGMQPTRISAPAPGSLTSGRMTSMPQPGPAATANLDYSIPIASAQPERIVAPRPGSMTTGSMTPIPGSGGPSPSQQAYLDQTVALENALAQQQAGEPQRIAAQEAWWRQRDATTAEANRAGADEEAANAAYGTQGAARTPNDPAFLLDERRMFQTRATQGEANRAGADEEAANAAYSPVAAAMMTDLEEPAPMGTTGVGGGPDTAQPQRAGALDPRQGGAPRGEMDPTLANRAAIRDAMRAFAGMTEEQLWAIDRSRFDDAQFDAWRRAVSAAMMDPQLRRPGG